MVKESLDADIHFIRVLRSLIKAKLPFADGFRMWGMPSAPPRQALHWRNLCEALGRGHSLKESLVQSSFPVSSTLLHFLDSMEHMKDPAAFLEDIEKNLSDREKINACIREILIYPILLLMTFSIVIVTLSLTFYDALYALRLPDARPFFLDAYAAVYPFRGLLALLPLMTLVFGVWLWKNPSRLPFPLLSRLVLESRRALLCAMLKLELSAQKTLAEAFDSLSSLFPPPLSKELLQARDQSRSGLPLDPSAHALMTAQMRFVLNHAGTSPAAMDMLDKLAVFHREQMNLHHFHLQKYAQMWMEVILGIVVGGYVIQVFMHYYGYLLGRAAF